MMVDRSLCSPTDRFGRIHIRFTQRHADDIYALRLHGTALRRHP
jgi:hypothetical protein